MTEISIAWERKDNEKVRKKGERGEDGRNFLLSSPPYMHEREQGGKRER